MKTSLTLLLLAMIALSGCIENAAFIRSEDLEAHRASLGRNIRAVPGQQIVLFGYLTLPMAKVALSQLKVANGIEVTHEPFIEMSELPPVVRGATGAALSLEGFHTAQLMHFALPEDTPTGQQIEMVYEARDDQGIGYRATATLEVVTQEEAGQAANYHWDLRLFAEYDQPEDQIPEVSVFDVAGTSALMRSLYPEDYPEEDFPFPLLFQPQTDSIIGSRDIPVHCSLPIGSGYCVALEDQFHDGADKDYDLWFGIRPYENRLILEAKGLSGMGAKNATDLLLEQIDPNVMKISLVRSRRLNGGGNAYDFHSIEMFDVVNGQVRIPLWADQNTVLEDDKYEWNYDFSFVSL